MRCEDEKRLLRVHERNKTAVKIAQKYDLSIIDLYTISMGNLGNLIDGVHFNDKGYVDLAEMILRNIESQENVNV